MSYTNKHGRDELLEEILSSVGNGNDNRTDNSRAARAAASSANRAASEKHTSTSSYQRASYGTPTAGRSGVSGYNTAADARRNTYTSQTSSISRNYAEHTGSINKQSTDRTGSLSRTMHDSRTGSVKSMQKRTGNTAGMKSAGRTASMSRTMSERTGNVNRNTMNRSDENSRTGRVRNDDPLDIVEKVSAIRSANASNAESAVPMRSRRRRKQSRASGRLPMVLIVTTIIFTIAISLSILIISVGKDMLAIGKSDDIKIINIPEGSTTEDVAQILYNEGIIKMPKAFVFISKLGKMDTKYIAGEHELSPSNAYETIINELTTDKSLEKETVNVTFIEGCSVITAGKKLEEAGVCEAERFIYYFNAGDYGYDFENYLPASTASKFNRMEGYLFPDTYTFYVDTDPEVVCKKIYKNFDEKFKAEYYTQMKKMNMTLDEVITLASIVQAESADEETMKKIASVFENRLASPEEFPKLQSDPTTYYVDEIIKPNIEIPSNAIFEAYDTYQCNGLPPGAIGNPGTAAIEAVLFPAQTKYYFFYSDIDTMETFFAETDEEHEKNKAMVNKNQTVDDDEAGDDEDNDEYYE